MRIASLYVIAPLLLAAIKISPAQPVERHLPSAPQTPATPIAAPNAVPSEQDDEPIGPALRAIALLGMNDPVRATLPGGVAVGTVPRLGATAAQTRIGRLLTPFLGRPLSRKLIAQIEAAVAGHYRDLHYPFVSLSTPEQRIDDGSLQIRIIEFTAGEISLRGAEGQAAHSIRKRLGLRPGDALDARSLGENLGWINRYPFRQVRAIFTPGQSVGTSDLALEAVHAKPWQIYGGESNDGSPSTGFYRYFAGGSFGNLMGRDSLLSFRVTASPDRPVAEPFPRYQGAAVTYSLPLGRNGILESSAQIIQTNQPVEPFTTGLRAFETSVGYRFTALALGRRWAGTDARFGLEANHQTSKLFFGELEAYGTSMNVYQLYLGLHHSGEDRAGAQSLDLSLHLSPGNLGPANGADQAWVFSQGRLNTMRYGYVDASYSRSTALGAAWSLKNEVTAQFTRGPLPRTAQMGFGSVYLIRGYTLDNGAYDSALITRSEVHAPPLAWRGLRADPYAFADAGYGRDNFRRQGYGLASAGAGVNVRLSRRLSFGVVAGAALVNNANIRAGNVILYQNITATF